MRMDQTDYSGTAAEILDAAERHMRLGGYDAVSFRDLAADVGIKSASVHYHFPQKADLGEAAVRRYTQTILAALGAPDDPAEAPRDRIARLCGVYRSALVDDAMICLCCVLGAETQDLPETVADAVSAYFEQLLDWTRTALAGRKGEEALATEILAGLQGAMILALATREPDRFEAVAAGLLRRSDN